MWETCHAAAASLLCHSYRADVCHMQAGNATSDKVADNANHHLHMQPDNRITCDAAPKVTSCSTTSPAHQPSPYARHEHQPADLPPQPQDQQQQHALSHHSALASTSYDAMVPHPAAQPPKPVHTMPSHQPEPTEPVNGTGLCTAAPAHAKSSNPFARPANKQKEQQAPLPDRPAHPADQDDLLPADERMDMLPTPAPTTAAAPLTGYKRSSSSRRRHRPCKEIKRMYDEDPGEEYDVHGGVDEYGLARPTREQVDCEGDGCIVSWHSVIACAQMPWDSSHLFGVLFF